MSVVRASVARSAATRICVALMRAALAALRPGKRRRHVAAVGREHPADAAAHFSGTNNTNAHRTHLSRRDRPALL